MSSFKRIAAGASALVLASGAALAGAGVAGAQGSSAIAADLELAATALNGPVTVTGNDEGGPTVSYENENEVDQKCVGFTMPYSTVDEQDIDPGGIGGDIIGALPLINAIEAAGDVHILGVDEDGEPVSFPSDPRGGFGDPTSNGVIAAALNLIAGDGVAVPVGEAVEWAATGPTSPSAAVLLCVPNPEDPESLLALNFGIDPQVVADQINDRLGPLGSIGAGSVSGGSVGMGASLLGSLGDDDDSQPEESDGSSMMSSGVSEAGSGNDDEDGELPAATLVN